MQLIHQKNGEFFNSWVWKDKDTAIKCVEPLTSEAEDMLFKEHDILLEFDTPYIVKPLDYKMTPEGLYVLITEWIEPTPIKNLQKFCDGCLEILKILDEKKIRHRDIRTKNIIPNKDTPVLIDFGWAHRIVEPPAIPDSDLLCPDDRKAMAGIMEKVKKWQSQHTRSLKQA